MFEFLDKVMEFLSGNEALLAGLAVPLDLLFRYIPSKKPLSIIHLIAQGFQKVGELCLALAGVMDKIFGQKIK